MITASSDSRFGFTRQFIQAAALFARRARELEVAMPADVPDAEIIQHRAFVSTSIMQCAAALETEAHEICSHGPAAYLGSGHAEHPGRRVLKPLTEFVDRQETLARFEIIFHVLNLPALDPGSEPYQSAQLVVRLRNELTHYKSLWGTELGSRKLFQALEHKRHSPPPYSRPNMNFFPQRCLSADCAAWAVRSTVAFLEAIYAGLSVPSRFATYRDAVEP